MARLRGKKIREIQVRGPLRIENIELRLEYDGTFVAYYADNVYEAKDQEQLIAKLRVDIARVQQITYTKYIVVEFEKRTSRNWDPQDLPKSDTRGFTFDFEVVEVSDLVTHGSSRLQRRWVERNGKLVPQHDDFRDRTFGDPLRVVYTEERYAKLKKILGAVQDLVEGLEMFLGENSDSGKLLAAIEGKLLLPGFRESK